MDAQINSCRGAPGTLRDYVTFWWRLCHRSIARLHASAKHRSLALHLWKSLRHTSGRGSVTDVHGQTRLRSGVSWASAGFRGSVACGCTRLCKHVLRSFETACHATAGSQGAWIHGFSHSTAPTHLLLKDDRTHGCSATAVCGQSRRGGRVWRSPRRFFAPPCGSGAVQSCPRSRSPPGRAQAMPEHGGRRRVGAPRYACECQPPLTAYRPRGQRRARARPASSHRLRMTCGRRRRLRRQDTGSRPRQPQHEGAVAEPGQRPSASDPPFDWPHSVGGACCVTTKWLVKMRPIILGTFLAWAGGERGVSLCSERLYRIIPAPARWTRRESGRAMRCEGV